MNNFDQFSKKDFAQGYVHIVAHDLSGKKVYDSFGHNTVVNDARRSAAAAFANLPGNVGLGFAVKQYRMGYSNVLANHWDSVNSKPAEAPFTQNTLNIQYPGSATTDEYFHTQADVSGLLADGLHWVGSSSPLAQKAISLGVDYPFNGDENAVRLYVELDATTSVGAIFDTVEVVLENGKKFAHRWVNPVTKATSWNLAISHLILF
jgi:hypothetical protein